MVLGSFAHKPGPSTHSRFQQQTHQQLMLMMLRQRIRSAARSQAPPSSARATSRAAAGAPPAPAPSPAGDDDAKDKPHTDELAAYLALPQVNNENEWTPLKWWEQHAKQFPNLSVMARQYLGCPATSATVERLFSQVGIAYSAKRKSGGADTIADIIFTEQNVA